MRFALTALAVLLAGCAQTMTLYPRGTGGTPIQGDLSTTQSTMSVAIDGETYQGDFKRGKSFGVSTGFSGTKMATGTGVAYSNQYAGLLVSPSGKTLRCEFVGGLMETGNGVCQHGDGRVFDLLLKP